MTDPIADMLTRIRNALAVRKGVVSLPFSRMKHGIALVLKEEEYIDDVAVVPEGGWNVLHITLKYVNTASVIRSLKRISKPGTRTYAKAEDLPVVLNGLGIAIVSTSRGVMSNRKAKRLKVGGEVLCEVY